LLAKNTLTASDAQVIEGAFRARVAALGDGRAPDGLGALQASAVAPEHPSQFAGSAASVNARGNSPAGLVAKAIRLRDKEHRRFVSKQPCLVCGRIPAEPHHLRFAQPRALGRKVSDEFTVPLCRLHHRELHRQGDEAAWWDGVNIDPVPIALALWQRTRTGTSGSPASAGTEMRAAPEQGNEARDLIAGGHEPPDGTTDPSVHSDRPIPQ
jgi:hypothetical protein